MPESHPLIISGAPRSGTSLLYNLFDGHTDVAWLVDEGFFFEYLEDVGVDATQVFLDALPEDVDTLVEGLRDKQVIPPLHESYRQTVKRGSVSEVEIDAPWDEGVFRERLGCPREQGVDGLWRWLVAACLAGMGQTPRKFACMKSPDYGKSATGALSNIDSARAIVIFRDPLYAIDSLKRSRELRGEKRLTWPLIAQNISAFQKMHERVRNASPNRLRTVRYESLVTDPKQIMSEIANWLGIGFEPCLLEPTMRGQRWPGISSFKPTDGIEKGPVDRPIQALTESEQDLIRRHLSDIRTAFEYD